MLEAIEDTLHQWFSKCSSLTSSISITRKLIRNTGSWALPGAYLPNQTLTEIPYDSDAHSTLRSTNLHNQYWQEKKNTVKEGNAPGMLLLPDIDV